MNFLRKSAMVTASLALCCLFTQAVQAALVSATARDALNQTATQAPTSNAFNISLLFPNYGAGASYDGIDHFGSYAAYLGSSKIIYTDSYIYQGATQGLVFYDYHIEGFVNSAIFSGVNESAHADATVDIFVNGLNVFHTVAIASSSGSTLGLLDGTIDTSAFSCPAFTCAFLDINHTRQLGLGIHSPNEVINVRYEFTTRANSNGDVGAFAALSDPGGFSANPSGRFSFTSVTDASVPVPMTSALIALGLAVLSGLRVRRR
jgi:hypothetical protein